MESSERKPRPFDFLKNLNRPKADVPSNDYKMYERMDAALSGVHERLEQMRRNYGPSYQAQNLMSDLSKKLIEVAISCDGNEESIAFLDDDISELSRNFTGLIGEVEEAGNRFSRTIWQEAWEGKLFLKIWPVVVGQINEVPELTPWTGFGGNVQSYLYGFLDLVSELGKATGEYIYKKEMSSEEEMNLLKRFITVGDSILLRLSQERHFPGYVISNGYGHWMSYTHKLRGAQGTVANVRRDYNLLRSIYKMSNKG